jgi:hypothetical protein
MIFFILITQIIKYNLKINNKNNLEKEELHPRIKNWRADQVTLSNHFGDKHAQYPFEVCLGDKKKEIDSL